MKCKKRNDNRGLTLVEVIVSMLILAIIVVPLLSSFVLSSRVNLKSRTKQYATILGQNVMEGIKNYDLEQIALQFNGKIASGGAFTIIPDSSFVDKTYGIGFYEARLDEIDGNFYPLSILEPGDQDKISIGLNDSKLYFKGNLEDTYYYLLKGVKEGTKRFDVNIKISSNNYQGVASGAGIQQNSYELPDVTNLDVNETAVINPAGIGIHYKNGGVGYELDAINDVYTIDNNHTFDVAAIDYFYNEYRAYRDYTYLEFYAGAIPTPVLPLEYTRAEIQKKVSRTTTISITDRLIEGKNKILVTTKLDYKFRGGENILYKAGALDQSNASKQFGGFYEQVAFDTLEQIYLFHTPLIYDAWDISLGDVIIVDNHSALLGDELKVFVAQQRIYGVADGGFHNIDKIRVKATGEATNKIHFYYNSAISGIPLVSADVTYNLQSGTKYETLVTNGAIKDRIYEVKIQVYEQGSHELLNELSSTFTR